MNILQFGECHHCFHAAGTIEALLVFQVSLACIENFDANELFVEFDEDVCPQGSTSVGGQQDHGLSLAVASSLTRFVSALNYT